MPSSTWRMENTEKRLAALAFKDSDVRDASRIPRVLPPLMSLACWSAALGLGGSSVNLLTHLGTQEGREEITQGLEDRLQTGVEETGILSRPCTDLEWFVWS